MLPRSTPKQYRLHYFSASKEINKKHPAFQFVIAVMTFCSRYNYGLILFRVFVLHSCEVKAFSNVETDSAISKCKFLSRTVKGSFVLTFSLIGAYCLNEILR